MECLFRRRTTGQCGRAGDDRRRRPGLRRSRDAALHRALGATGVHDQTAERDPRYSQPTTPTPAAFMPADPAVGGPSSCLPHLVQSSTCLLYTSDAADEEDSV